MVAPLFYNRLLTVCGLLGSIHLWQHLKNILAHSLYVHLLCAVYGNNGILLAFICISIKHKLFSF